MVVLYRKYRPQQLSDLIGQDVIKDTLTDSLKLGKIAHAYLFTGPKGTGKTTTARILAKMLNCEKNSKQDISFGEPCNKCDSCVSITDGAAMDVLEIDAASNRGIDDIRDLKEKIKLAPIRGKYKVYIIDEVHMLTAEAFNALLKTLEEPPSHSVFILCTTDPKKVPETIGSRCQKFEFKKAKNEQLVQYLKKIAAREKIEVEEEALLLIAKNATGGYRDAVSLLDQLISGNEKVTKEAVQNKLSLSDEETIRKFLQFLTEKNAKKSLELISVYVGSGHDIYSLVRDLLLHLEKLMLAKLGIGDNLMDTEMTLNDLKTLAGMLSKCESEMKFAFLSQLPLEILVIDWCGEDTGLPVKQKAPDDDGSKKPEKVLLADETKDTKDDNSNIKIEAESADKAPEEFKDDYTTLTIENIAQKWPEVLSLLKPFNHSLESLLRKCEMSEFDGKTLLMAAYYKLHKDVLMDPKNLRVINDCLTKVLGEDINLMVGIKPKPEIAVNPEDNSDELATAAEKLFN